MATGDNAELVDDFLEFYRTYYRDEIGTLAQQYPNERRSLYVDWNDLYTFDADLADDYRSQPEQLQEYAEEALRLYDLPVDVSLGQAHVRIEPLPDPTEIREIRSRHVNTLVTVRGIVRKATDVKSKMEVAAFECQRCGTLTRIPQSTGTFQEPHECQGCERQGPFVLNHDQSEFVDAQKIRVQESPEGLRGGETPQAIDVHIEDDITGDVTPGDHVAATGILRLEQQGNQQEKSPLFDHYLEGVSVRIDEEQFEDMEITEEDKAKIVSLSDEPDIYEQMVGSIAPSIFGYDQEKLAMILQLFSGVTKHLPDGSRIRGDLHMLLIGDPGTGKCVRGDTRVTLADGSEVEIRDLVESNLDDPTEVDDGWWDGVDIELPSMQPDGTIGTERATKVWKREAPETMYRIRTGTGKEIEVTPSHPLFVQRDAGFDAVRAEDLEEGVTVAVANDVAADGGVAVDAQTTPSLTEEVTWDNIASIEPYEPDDEWVYDLEVAETHTYVSNGVVSHNSQMLSYIKNVAPRSVYTSGKGSSSAGLCVTGDTRIQTGDGLVPIRDIALEEHPEPVDADTRAERSVPLQTFDYTTTDVVEGESSHVWRMPEKPCHRVETAHGKSLEASVNTPVLTCGNDGLEWVQVSEVEPGEYVAVPRYDDIDREEVPVREFLELASEKVKLADESVERLRSALAGEFGHLRAAAAALGLSEDFVYDSVRNRHVPLEKLDTMLDAVGMKREDLAFERLMIRHGDSIEVPETFDADLMYLLGFVFGDGDISLDRRDGNRGTVRISNSDEALLERAADIFAAKFDKRPEIEYQDERVPCIRVNSATVARLFANAGMETPKVDLELAPELTTAAHADAFLRGFMDADGAVSARDDGGSSVIVSTISEGLAEQLQLMLETYGIRARRRERDRRGTYELADGKTITSKHVQHFVELYGADIERYADAIGFAIPEKRAALDEITDDATRRGEKMPVGDVLVETDGGSVAGNYHENVRRGDNPSRERARSMLEDIDVGDAERAVREVVDADLRWDRVTDVVDVGEKEVFDLTVPETHNFVGNGIVTHNTAAAVRDDFGDGQQWTLEAGALVLADQGIAAVDELDKMRCVTGDSLVHLGNGRIARIRDLAREASTDGRIEELENGRTFRDVEYDAWTMTDDGRLVRRPVTAIHEYDAPEELTAVTLETGERLTTTDDHPFFVAEDGERVERPAAALEAGDWTFVPRHVPSQLGDGGIAVAGSTEPMQENTVSPSLGAVLGYLAGDGNLYYERDAGAYGIRFTNSEEELLRDFELVCEEAFDATPIRAPSEQREDGVETVRLPGKAHADAVLDAGMNLETYDGKRLPESVTESSRETKAAFVRSLADSEASVGKRHVRIHSASYELLLGTKQLLLEFGITSQLETRERDGKRDLHVLNITDATSLTRFADRIGFTLSRKQEALDAALERVTGDRTILDVIPAAGTVLKEAREELRLYQSECGIDDATYCNFENEDANVSIRLARTILRTFETRRVAANEDLQQLGAGGWTALDELKRTYHVSQSEIAAGTPYSQQQISRNWGTCESLRETVRDRLAEILRSVADTDLTTLKNLVNGDVKWRRVQSVEQVSPGEVEDDRIELLREDLAEILGCGSDEAIDRAEELLSSNPRDATTWRSLRSEMDRHGLSFQTLASDLGVAGSTVSRWFDGVVETDEFEAVREAVLARLESIRTDVRETVAEIESRRDRRVYDLTVEGTHNFVANGMVVHNSEDRSAMHQALEQQEISVSKAGINATLKSRCSLLGAANPKYGRFDQYEPIGEQIELEPALISRFDLIFTVTDSPDEEHDSDLAEHILTTNYAGELNTQREYMTNHDVEDEEVESITESVDPVIDPELMRKYIAYAKQNCYPRMTEAARQAMQDFYVDLRSKGQDEDAPVPVTARQLEALVRLAEASARVRLSDTVEEADAERVITIVRECLQDIGVDPETGEFDADVIETGTSKTQRDRIKNLKQLIGDIEDDYDEGAPVDVVLDRADEIGMDPSKAEHEIEKLKQKGEVYEPRTDHLRTT
ncbi:LAGLIDADG family homing endonuclease [Haloarchaeobius sp. HRN-SO-5]|uniref:LAGLIDADG family homing endonuclease n=1 Tax=Haloarchaeobius sp. HRN-SO-5 TaxID=3446118 RepID=UPI003EBD8A48